MCFLLSSLTAFSSDKDCSKNIDTFLDCNNLKVISYLKKLTNADIGKVLKGLQLTDGTSVLKNYTFIGKADGIVKGAHLYVFEFKRQRSAYIWIDKTGSELLLPRCLESVSHESAYVLSGDVYTWKALQPGHGVVHAMCLEDSWIQKLK